MRYSVVVEERDYVPYPLATLVAGVFVLSVGFWINRYLTGSPMGYSGHGVFLILLGTVTVFSSASSVATMTQWKYGVGLLSALIGSSVITTIYPGLSGNLLIKEFHAGLQVAVLIVGLLAVANTTARYRTREKQPEGRV